MNACPDMSMNLKMHVQTYTPNRVKSSNTMSGDILTMYATMNSIREEYRIKCNTLSMYVQSRKEDVEYSRNCERTWQCAHVVYQRKSRTFCEGDRIALTKFSRQDSRAKNDSRKSRFRIAEVFLRGSTPRGMNHEDEFYRIHA
jgi:hypothetical protein